MANERLTDDEREILSKYRKRRDRSNGGGGDVTILRGSAAERFLRSIGLGREADDDDDEGQEDDDDTDDDKESDGGDDDGKKKARAGPRRGDGKPATGPRYFRDS